MEGKTEFCNMYTISNFLNRKSLEYNLQSENQFKNHTVFVILSLNMSP